MEQVASSFELIYNLSIIRVKQSGNEAQAIYQVEFSNEVPALQIQRAEHAEAKHWQSLPPGNEELASGIGKLIDDYEAGVTNS